MGCARNQVSQVRPCVLVCATMHPSALDKISKRTQADRASEEQINSLDVLTSWVGGIDEANGVVSNRLEVWKERAL